LKNLSLGICLDGVFYKCVHIEQKQNKVGMECFGKLKDGTEVHSFTINNDDGSSAQFTNYGATVVSIKVPDRNGVNEHVVLGFDNVEKYEVNRAFYGSTVGRYGNRINEGKFTLDGKEYVLNTNEGPNHLHGGLKGFDRIVWDYEILDDNIPAIRFSHLSEAGEENYPGNLNVTVTYYFSKNHELIIEYEMITDAPTIKNVTNHSYFNLSGNVDKSILDHTLMLNADQYLSIDKNLIPTGRLLFVKNTPMDFLKSVEIGERISDNYQQLELGGGYDHCWVLRNKIDKPMFAGEVYEPDSGRMMKVITTEPAIQFYSGNFMDGSHSGRERIPYKYRHAMVLETQHYPDSPNHPDFPTTRLDPGEVYKSKTIYEFSVK
jgi:aldose 1-epimerase